MLLAAGAACSRRAWRDDRTGPLLAVFWPAALATVVQSGFFLAGYPPALSAIDRYVTYAVPLALILMTVLLAHPRLLSRTAMIVAGLLSLTLLARPAIQMIGEERASWGISYRLDHVLGLGIGIGLTLVALALLWAVGLLRARETAPARAVLIIGAAMLAVFAVQSQAAWWQMTKTGTSFRSIMPADLEWVDHHASGPVALLGITQNAPQFDDIDFFNRKITQAYAPAAGLLGRKVQGTSCSMRFAVSGELVLGAGCGPRPSRFLINDPSARVTFQDEVRSASEPQRRPARRAEAIDGPARPVADRPALPAPHARLRRQQPGHRRRRLADHLRARDDGGAVARCARAGRDSLPRRAPRPAGRGRRQALEDPRAAWTRRSASARRRATRSSSRRPTGRRASERRGCCRSR